MDRRAFLKTGIGAGLFLAGLHPPVLMAGESGLRLLSCRSDHQGRHYLSILDTSGSLSLDIPLPGRGHGIAFDPRTQRAAVFARRPGTFVWVIDLRDGKVTHRIQAAAGRHFYGHGVFTPDGHLLCSENAYATGQGVIGIYRAKQNFQRDGEFASHGIGPHQLGLLSDTETLVVANGGIRTHPDMPRIKTNLRQMQPNLAYLNARDGRLLQRQQPPAEWHQLSIRHIAVAPDDSVAVAMQFEGRPHLQPPLIALHRDDQPLQLLKAPKQVQKRLRNYCGSVAFSEDGSRFAVSSPRGGVVTYWSATGDYLGLHEQADACGVSPQPDAGQGFLVSDGEGEIRRIGPGLLGKPQQQHPAARWDNHLLALSL